MLPLQVLTSPVDLVAVTKAAYTTLGVLAASKQPAGRTLQQQLPATFVPLASLQAVFDSITKVWQY